MTKATEKGHGTGTCSVPLFLSDPQRPLMSKLEKNAALECIYIYVCVCVCVNSKWHPNMLRNVDLYGAFTR